MNEFLEAYVTNPERASVMVAGVAVVIASISLITTFATLYIQRVHNRKSVAPVAEFTFGDYEGKIEVSIANKGIGPLIIDHLNVRVGGKIYGNLISLMPVPPEGILWSDFTVEFEERCLSPGEELCILRLVGDSNCSTFGNYRDDVRRVLSQGSIQVEYSDVYSKSIKPKSRELNWFARMIS